MNKIDHLNRQIDDLRLINAMQRDEIERLRDALSFYANKENWDDLISLGHPQIDGITSNVKIDNGEVARSALKQKEIE